MSLDPIVSALEGLARRVRKLEAQIVYVPLRSAVFIYPVNFVMATALRVAYQGGYAFELRDGDDGEAAAHFITDHSLPDYSEWNFWIYFTMKSNVTGNIRLSFSLCYTADGESLPSNCSSITVTIPAPTTADVLEKYLVPMTFTIPGANVVTVTLVRPTLSDPLDTASDDMIVIGLEAATI